MAGEQQNESANPQATKQIEAGIAKGAGALYTIPARRVIWLRIYLLIPLAMATATVAVLFSGDPADRPLWFILLAVAIVVGCLLLAYALGKAIIHPARQPQSPQSPLA